MEEREGPQGIAGMDEEEAGVSHGLLMGWNWVREVLQIGTCAEVQWGCRAVRGKQRPGLRVHRTLRQG